VGALLVLSVVGRADPRGDALTLLAPRGVDPSAASLGADAAASVPYAPARPLIGVVAMPVMGESGQSKEANHTAYIAASYIKYIEAAGARAVPILWTMDDAEITRRFHAVNGLLFPGGGGNVCDGRYAAVGRLLLKLALQANDAGAHFPVWGTCLGYEQLAIAVADDCSILGHFDAEDDAGPLVLTDEAAESRLFGVGSAMRAMVTSNAGLAMENHASGVSLDVWQASAKLTAFFRVVSYSVDRNGVKYVSTVEGRDYPVYATQWHPEKNSFEWTKEQAIPHGADATLLSQSTANFLVAEARKSPQRPLSYEDELGMLIYNHQPTFTALTWPSFKFDQVYFFDQPATSDP
jgi:gamma-glutamyl hydrolase